MMVAEKGWRSWRTFRTGCSAPAAKRQIERFFRSLEEECVWEHDYAGFIEVDVAVRRVAGYGQNATAAPGPTAVLALARSRQMSGP